MGLSLFSLLMLLILGGLKQGHAQFNYVISTAVGDGTAGSLDATATSAELYNPCSVWGAPNDGNIYIVDYQLHTIRSYNHISGVVNTPYTSVNTLLSQPVSVFVNTSGEIFVADRAKNLVYRFGAGSNYANTIAIFAGSVANAGYFVGDNGPATSAGFSTVSGVWGDSNGNVYIADTNFNRIRMVNNAGIIVTVAGSSSSGYGGDNSAATSASLSQPTYIWGDITGQIYFADTGNNVVRRFTVGGGIITFAGSSSGTFPGNGGPATSSLLSGVYGIWGDTNGNVFFSDSGHYQVRGVDNNGIIHTIAGSTSGYSGNGGAATSAQFASPEGIWGDLSGNIYVVDRSNMVLRKLSLVINPTLQPSSRQPSRQPTKQPLAQPTCQPSCQPTSRPTDQPTSNPTQPSSQPSTQPTIEPSCQPSGRPSRQPTIRPTSQPSIQPTSKPSKQPTQRPTNQPTAQPSNPSTQPSSQPTDQPTFKPSAQPTSLPSSVPSTKPSDIPTFQPTSQPMGNPTSQPSSQPADSPSFQPTSNPTQQPFSEPSCQPTQQPTEQPFSLPSTQPSCEPTVFPTSCPSSLPSAQPSFIPSSQPFAHPSTQPTTEPSNQPSSKPSSLPSIQPTIQPTGQPSSVPSYQSTSKPSTQPSSNPSYLPTAQPSSQPSRTPTEAPTNQPTTAPSLQSVSCPTTQPSSTPSRQPISFPSSIPSSQPSSRPTEFPSSQPSFEPSAIPSISPSNQPSSQPSGFPSNQPNTYPTTQPTSQPNSRPTSQPSGLPSVEPSLQPTRQPTHRPSTQPSLSPTSQPTDYPSSQPSNCPSTSPSGQPSSRPSAMPSNQPSVLPTVQPSHSPSAQPSQQPTTLPTTDPSSLPTGLPTYNPVLKKVNFQLDNVYYLQNSYTPVGAFVSVSSPPISKALEIKFGMKSDFCNSIVNFFPPSIIFTPVNGSTQSAISLTVVGNFNRTLKCEFQVTLHGAASFEYASYAEFNPSNIITVLNMNGSSYIRPKPPKLIAAAFSADGRYSTLSFDSPTNRGGYQNYFPCESVLDFPGSHRSVCRWISSYQIRIDQMYKPSSNGEISLEIGSNITILEGNSIKAGCPSSFHDKTVCDRFAEAETATVQLMIPNSRQFSSAGASQYTTDAIALQLPNIVMSVPNTISQCMSLPIDLSLSTGAGAGGRPWKSHTFSVSRLSSGGIITDVGSIQIQKYLNDSTTLQSPILIPSSWLIPNNQYLIGITLCNFLDACAYATKMVQVMNMSNSSIPIVTITGSNLRVMHRSNDLLLEGNVYFDSSCQDHSNATANYSWSVTAMNGVSNKSIPISSISQNPFVFHLPAYTLNASVDYQINFVAYWDNYTFSDSVIVRVQPGPIVAEIVGNAEKSRVIGINQSTVIDASTSYDTDVQRRSGDNLRYIWSCVQVLPIFRNQCNQSINYFPLETDCKKLVLRSQNNPFANSTSRLSLTVVDVVTNRLSATFVDVYVQPEIQPILNLLGSTKSVDSLPPSTQKLSSSLEINPSDQLFLSANIISSRPIYCSWDVNDRNVNLSTVAVSNLQLQYNVSSTTSWYFFSVKSNILTAGSNLQFSLSCGKSKSSFTVQVNDVPMPGYFWVTPSSGVPLTTNFTFLASAWSDADYPLSYQFGYFASTSSQQMLVLIGSTQLSYGLSMLPFIRSNPNITCSLQVVDFLGASTSAAFVVQIKSISSSIHFPSLKKIPSSNFVDAVRQIVILGASVLNNVPCKSYLNCSTLNREQCSSVANACGDCKYGYFGESGGSNDPCFQSNSNMTLSSLGTYCNSFIDCPTTMLCTSHRCVWKSKSCLEKCSGHGKCTYSKVYNGMPVTDCSVIDYSCTASCQCTPPYAGMSCEMLNSTLALKRSQRSQLLSSLDYLTTIDDVNQYTVVSWSSSLATLTNQPIELTPSAISTAISISNKILSLAGSLHIPSENLQNIVQSTDDLLSAVTLSSVDYNVTIDKLHRLDKQSQRRALASLALNASYNATTLPPVSSLTYLIQSYGNITGRGMIPGQSPMVFIQKNYRLSSNLITNSDGMADSHTIEVPRTQYEMINATSSSSQIKVKLNSNSTDIVRVNAVQSYPKLYGVGTSLQTTMNANPLQIVVDQGIDRLDNLVFTLAQNAENPKYDRSIPSNLTAYCNTLNITETFSHYCDDSGVWLSHSCSLSRRGIFVYYCPVLAPTCDALDPSSLSLLPTSNVSCIIDSYSPSYASCRCNVSSGSILDQSGLPAFIPTSSSTWNKNGLNTIVTASTYTGQVFTNTFQVARENPVVVLEKAIIVESMFGSMWGLGLLILFMFSYRVRVDMKKKESGKISDAIDHTAVVHIDIKRGESKHSSINQSKLKLLNYILDVIPDVFSDEPFLKRMFHELGRHHKYFSIFTASNEEIDDRERVIIMMKILTVQTMLMFLLAVLYDTQAPDDDGTCNNYTTEATCLHRTSPFDSTQTYCDWNSQVDPLSACTYGGNNVSILASVYIIIVTSIFTELVNSPIDWLFEILLAPDIEEIKDSHLLKVNQEVMKLGHESKTIEFSLTQANLNNRSTSTEAFHHEIFSQSGNQLNAVEREKIPLQSKGRRSSIHREISRKVLISKEIALTTVPFTSHDETDEVDEEVLFLQDFLNKDFKADNLNTQSVQQDPMTKDAVTKLYEMPMEEVEIQSEVDSDDLLSVTSRNSSIPMTYYTSHPMHAADTTEVVISETNNPKKENQVTPSPNPVDINAKRVLHALKILFSKIFRQRHEMELIANEMFAPLQGEVDDLLIEIEKYDKSWGIVEKAAAARDWVDSLFNGSKFHTATRLDELLDDHYTSIMDIIQQPKQGKPLEIQPHVMDAIKKDVEYVHSESNLILERFIDIKEQEQGVEILHYFILDLLGRDTFAAKLFENKFQEDFETKDPSSMVFKVLAATLLLGLDIFFIYYSILKGAEKGSSWQASYAFACLTQFFIAIFVFETMESVWVHFFLPDIAGEGMMTVYQILQDIVDDLSQDHAKSIYQNQRHLLGFRKELNASRYLFISSKLAKAYPRLLESRMVRSYSSYLPGQLGKRWMISNQLKTTSNRSDWQSWLFDRVSNLVSILFALVLNMGLLSNAYQRLFVRFVEPFFLTSLILVWYYFQLDVALTIAFIFIIIALLATIVFALAYSSDTKRYRMRQSTYPTLQENVATSTKLLDFIQENEQKEDLEYAEEEEVSVTVSSMNGSELESVEMSSSSCYEDDIVSAMSDQEGAVNRNRVDSSLNISIVCSSHQNSSNASVSLSDYHSMFDYSSSDVDSPSSDVLEEKSLVELTNIQVKLSNEDDQISLNGYSDDFSSL